MLRRESYTPRHLAAPRATSRTTGPAAGAPRPGLRPLGGRGRAAAGLAVVAVTATGAAVVSGVLAPGPPGAETASAATAEGSGPGSVATAPRPGAARADTGLSYAGALRGPVDLSNRTRQVSRSGQRAAVDPVKAAALDQRSGGQLSETEDLTGGDPRTVARALLAQRGWGEDEFSCLDSIYVNESNWNVHADNPSSSAYGIPQALPGSKMASAGPDWENDATTQIRWGIGYIAGRYGTPCNAWGFKQGHGWY